MSSNQERHNYHHGDLRQSLIDHGLTMVGEVGIGALSLRKLAERVGVSPPALYHHFKNKQDLLLALGEASIDNFEAAIGQVINQTDASLNDFVLAYVRFARDNPEQYELMLGRDNWLDVDNTAFHKRARDSFRGLGQLLLKLQSEGHIAADINVLRLAQVAWATLHGLCRMYNDGLAFSAETVEDIALYALDLIRGAIGQNGLGDST